MRPTLPARQDVRLLAQYAFDRSLKVVLAIPRAGKMNSVFFHVLARLPGEAYLIDLNFPCDSGQTGQK
jgi:hypothetical protein